MPQELNIAIKGKKQGQFKSDTSDSKIIGRALSYEVKSPRDAATGQASGKRQYSPITITKEWGACSPQLFQALVTNEVLESVVLEFVRSGPDGKKIVVYTITLTNASVSNLKSYRDEHAAPDAGVLELEDVSLTFEKIDVQHNPTKTTAHDDVAKL
jgi:type VI secretion system secreted protein Hcp